MEGSARRGFKTLSSKILIEHPLSPFPYNRPCVPIRVFQFILGGVMESHLPTRPSSDLHRRFSTRSRPPAGMDRQLYISPGASGRNRQRSSSFSGISQSLSRLLPSNRPERGGTARPKETANDIGDIISPSRSLIQILSVRGCGEEKEGTERGANRARSLSPKKISVFDNERLGLGHNPGKPKKPSTLQKLWELHKGANFDTGIIDISPYHSRLRSDRREPAQSKQITLNVGIAGQEVDSDLSVPMAYNFRESVTALKRSQQLFEEKMARRKERRSFRRSDDFIGVQGVNPRTGYPDPNSGTSSSGGDALSESARKRLDEDEKRMAIASREYKAALERREKEIRRLELERERRRMEKKERVEKKRAQLRAKARKDGRWKNDGNTWSMVTEPGLSPILQSIAGTPTQESASQNLLPPINNDLAVQQSGTISEGDINPKTSPKTPQRQYESKIGSNVHTQREQKSYPHQIETASNRVQQRSLTGRPDSGNESMRHFVHPIRRKEVGSPIGVRHVSSSETVIHRTETAQLVPVELPDDPGLSIEATPLFVNPTFKVTTPGKTTHIMSMGSPTPDGTPFLDFLGKASQNAELQGNKAIATSYQLSPLCQGQTHHQLPQNRKDIFQDTHISTLKDFPPVVLKDPISAGIPPKLQSYESPPPLPTSKAILRFPPQERLGQVPGITIPTTITTGFKGLPRPLNQLDCFKVASESRVSHQDQPVTNTRISTPNFHPREMLNGMPNFGSQMNQADIAISLAHHPPAPWTPTKRHFPRICQQASPKIESVAGKKSISISTSTPPLQQCPPHLSAGAKNAAQAILTKTSTHRLCHEVKARSASLVSPRPGTTRVVEQACQEHKTLPEGNVGIEDLLKAPGGLDKSPQLLRERINYAKRLGNPSGESGNDAFIVWYTETERRLRFDNKPTEVSQEILSSLLKKKHEGIQILPCKDPEGSDKGARVTWLLRKSYGLVMGAVGTAWTFVLPVFNPGSSLRWRWLRNELTWQDMVLIGAAGIFGGGAFLIMVLLAKLLGVGMQIVKGCIKVCRVLAEL